MQWTALISTGLGAAIGVGSTLAADRMRWRRDSRERERANLQVLYAEFIEALLGARDDIDQISKQTDRSPQDRAQSVRDVIADHGTYTKEYQLELIAPASVIARAQDASHKLALYRDTVLNGATRDDPPCQEARGIFRDARKALVAEMRASLRRQLTLE
ncbi:hypothetical protein OHT59_45560 [Streptomyces sp. NBC_00243]|uniref:hypothetical protein n=1 Tax=Streptomyces sp. NBC_00243 TaxID=2975688 RepID=UPI002DDC2E45|nr:hypothetical protein [Streptomyces sp. NBC_00243]WRZ25282.1 hypothetical protein OHT59_45560 [Streptomyces sp. NBC_00243]